MIDKNYVQEGKYTPETKNRKGDTEGIPFTKLSLPIVSLYA